MTLRREGDDRARMRPGHIAQDRLRRQAVLLVTDGFQPGRGHLLQHEANLLGRLVVGPHGIQVVILDVRDPADRPEFVFDFGGRLVDHRLAVAVQPPKGRPRTAAPTALMRAPRQKRRHDFPDRQHFARGRLRHGGPVDAQRKAFRPAHRRVAHDRAPGFLPREVRDAREVPVPLHRLQQLGHPLVRIVARHHHVDGRVANQLLREVRRGNAAEHDRHVGVNPLQERRQRQAPLHVDQPVQVDPENLHVRRLQ